MSVQLLDHIGVVVRDMTYTLRQYQQVLGLAATHTENYGDGLLEIAFLPVGPESAFGRTKIELLQPLRPGSSAWNFLHDYGEGVEHLAFLVGDVNGELDRLAHLGVPMRDHVARPGAGGMQIAFLEPHALSGVLGELVMPFQQ